MIIAYADNTDFVYLVHPTQEALESHSFMTVALKDVPHGLPFWMVDESEIPADRTFRDAWEVPEEWGPPDGYGSVYCTFEEIEDDQDKQ